jgi:chromosome segregation ATPase
VSRTLQVLNLLGVLAMAGLCVVQWQTNSRLGEDVTNLELTRRQLTAHIAEQDQRIAEDAADLDDFRQRLMLAESEMKDLQAKLTTVTMQRDQLKAAVDAYAAAVAERDKAIALQSADIKKLITERDQLAAQYNDLAKKFNAEAAQR